MLTRTTTEVGLPLCDDFKPLCIEGQDGIAKFLDRTGGEDKLGLPLSCRLHTESTNQISNICDCTVPFHQPCAHIAASSPEWDARSYSTQNSTFSDYFVRDVRIFSTATNDWKVGRATFDTASTYNWVSKHFLQERLGSWSAILPHKQKRTCLAFSGHVIVPLGFVRLIWYDAENGGHATHQTQFLVVETDDWLFDIIVGSRTIIREKILSWHIAPVWPTPETQSLMPNLHGKARKEEKKRENDRMLQNQPLAQQTKSLLKEVYQTQIMNSQPQTNRATQTSRASSVIQEKARRPHNEDSETLKKLHETASQLSARDAVKNRWAGVQLGKQIGIEFERQNPEQPATAPPGDSPNVQAEAGPSNDRTATSNDEVRVVARSTSEQISEDLGNATSANDVLSTPATTPDATPQNQQREQRGILRKLKFWETSNGKGNGKGKGKANGK